MTDRWYRELRQRFRDLGADLRPHALELDRDPEAIREHFDLPAVRYLAAMGVPPEYGHDPEPIAGRPCHGALARERVVIMEELAAADAGMLVAAPGPLLAGVLVGLVADERQRELFYGRMLGSPLWTFFALTEPDRGSDAAGLTTALRPAEDGGYLLTGAKRYVGNACRAQLGVVFARTGPGPLGIVPVLLETPAEGFTAEPLPSIGLRGARISSIELDGVRVPEENVLGRNLSPTRRGMWAFVQTFNLLRPGVAAIGVGMARAAHEYVLAHRRAPSKDERHRIDALGRRIDGARALTEQAADAVDARTADGHLASAAKLRAGNLAEEAALLACEFFGPAARLEHPLLDKLVRDSKSLEFIEGTTHMQQLNLAQGLISGKVDGARRSA
ncbi:acyl-CoA/acyl-ACP dehydrogenase [Saccharopolyspora sp. NFXS83]|uniref:acyl-CoA dehydrogenase family protein n=1 Tax=Saccharopolyspora sp. NFXS83 TaxID=2993560 RepID=UPI00224ACF99|nr:acyl-CoA dehydrogenase family protein [Saccharopolyspora sp. NFXS83]MCX2732058.1 acyl-CoA/acyl-ACP dehydrogenase [Saccharopolyspora sp. NFXS83]